MQPPADRSIHPTPVFHLRPRARFFLLLLLSALMLPVQGARAEPDVWLYGDALFGDLKHEKGFDHYPHVNPDAPKGGTLNSAAYGGFDSFNPFVVQGRAAAGLTYTGGLLYDTLFEQAIDQPSASYGLIADSYRHAPDYGSAAYHID